MIDLEEFEKQFAHTVNKIVDELRGFNLRRVEIVLGKQEAGMGDVAYTFKDEFTYEFWPER